MAAKRRRIASSSSSFASSFLFFRPRRRRLLVPRRRPVVVRERLAPRQRARRRVRASRDARDAPPLAVVRLDRAALARARDEGAAGRDRERRHRARRPLHEAPAVELEQALLRTRAFVSLLRCTGMRSITAVTLRLDQFSEVGDGVLLLKRMYVEQFVGAPRDRLCVWVGRSLCMMLRVNTSIACRIYCLY